jgi:DNA-3-methyladenine glycosylase II
VAGQQTILQFGGASKLLNQIQAADQYQQHNDKCGEASSSPVLVFLLRLIVGPVVTFVQRTAPFGHTLCTRNGLLSKERQHWLGYARHDKKMATESAGKTMTDGLQHLGRDQRFAALIERVGKPRLDIHRQRSPYEALVRAIAHQQLHGRAAEAILGRFSALFPGETFPEPAAVLATAETALRGCGFSAGKIAAVRDICAKTIDGTVPTRRQSSRLTDDALIERLTTIRGVGRWTVEMLLIFTLGRPDVLPVDDFGVREGYRVLHELEEQPKPKQLAEIGKAWAPHRSLATWYLYRAAEAARRQGPMSRA